MGKGGKISEYRERLDKTLVSPELTNPDLLKTLVRNQLLRSSLDETEGCSENLIETRTNQMSHLLEMLRSASVTDKEVSKTTGAEHVDWKLKADNEEFRVMYRPGPQGTPLHTLLVEGYVDAPVHICLCVSWESTLYPKWWPQYTFPPFKITISKCLQRVRIGEHVSLMRVKITWPLTAREAVLHYFLFEYLKDDLIIVLVNTVSDSEGVDRETHGFTKDGIPEAKDVVRIDAVAGFAIQKVTPERSYFRTIGTVDLKLDFVPPSLINFIARQLIGNGFKLYQKAVVSVSNDSNHDKDYGQVLEDPVYARIQEALYSIHRPNEMIERKELPGDAHCPSKELCVGVMQTTLGDMDQNVCGDDSAIESLADNAQILDTDCFSKVEGEINQESSHFRDEIGGVEQEVHSSDHASEDLQQEALATSRKTFGEIEEDETDDSIRHLEISGNDLVQPSTYKIAQKSLINLKTNICISPEVENALETLEKVISEVRRLRIDEPDTSVKYSTKERSQNLEMKTETISAVLEDSGVRSNNKVSVEISDKGRSIGRTSHETRNSTSSRDIRRPGSSSFSREVNHNRIMPASPEQYLSTPSEKDQSALHPFGNGEQQMAAEIAVIDLIAQDAKKISTKVNCIHENSLPQGKELKRQKKHWLCCVSRF